MSATLLVDFCSYEAAKYACERFHYVRRPPKSKILPFGVWEDGRFIGAVIFGRGAASEIGSPFGLKQNRVCELVRVALREHQTPVTRILRIAVKMLKKQSPGLRLIVSYADTGEGHHGGIYQGAGWVYLGAKEYHAYRVLGELRHPKSLYGKYGPGGQSVGWLREHIDEFAERVTTPPKHKYALGLDSEMREHLKSIALPYPKPVRAGSIDSDARSYPNEKVA